jgi:hypothetical protein
MGGGLLTLGHLPRMGCPFTVASWLSLAARVALSAASATRCALWPSLAQPQSEDAQIVAELAGEAVGRVSDLIGDALGVLAVERAGGLHQPSG